MTKTPWLVAGVVSLGLILLGVVVYAVTRPDPGPVMVTVTATPTPALPEPSATSDADPTAEPSATERSGGYRTGEAVGEQLQDVWEQSKSFGRGLWNGLTGDDATSASPAPGQRP